MDADEGDGGVEQDRRRRRRTAARARGRAADRASRRRRSSTSASRHKRTSPGSAPRRFRRARSSRRCCRGARATRCWPGASHQPTSTSAAMARDLEHHQPALDVAAGAHAEAVDQRQQRERRNARSTPSGSGRMRQLAEIAREGDRHRRHPARLDDQQQRPAVEEGRHRPVGVAQIGILAADLGPPRGKLGIDECAGDRDRCRRAARRRRSARA